MVSNRPPFNVNIKSINRNPPAIAGGFLLQLVKEPSISEREGKGYETETTTYL